MGIKLKELSKLGYIHPVARSLAITIINKHCKHSGKKEITSLLMDLLEDPEKYKNDPIWHKLAEHFSPTVINKIYTAYELKETATGFKTYGSKYTEPAARQQMSLAMRLPVTLSGALMADAHAGYGLPIGGVIAVESAVIPYAIGVDIGCRMSLSILDAKPDFLKRYAHSLKEGLKKYTHFGIKGGLPFSQEHEILDRKEFLLTPFFRSLHAKAVRQLGSSGGGNHFVEFGEIELAENNCMELPAGNYLALLSHSGSRGIGAEIANYYYSIARETCKLPREAQHLAWLELSSEAGREYWTGMNLAGDYAIACHERIHYNLTSALGLKVLGNVSNHHNFAWKEEIAPGKQAIVHRKGATPAGKGIPGIIPGSMATPGYLVCGKGVPTSLCSASHGAGRAMSRQQAKSQFTRSAMKKYLSRQQVTLIGGTVEEMPLAYKDIDRVMQEQQELVEIHGKFIPRIVRMNNE